MPHSVAEAQRYLERFGYLEHPVLEDFGFALSKAFTAPLDVPGELTTRTRAAIASFQTFVGLFPTGFLDEATLAFMERPRCGFPDVGSFVLWSNKWQTRELHYGFAETTTQLAVFPQRAAFREALKLWRDVCGMDFAERAADDADIVIRFVRGEHGDGNGFDGPGNVLAHAFFPSGGVLSGDAHFDDEERWAVVAGQGMDLVTIAAHEFGHSLGLAHSATPGALMFPYYSGPHRFLHADDVAGIQQLYGARSAPAPPPAPPMPVWPYFTTSERSAVFHDSHKGLRVRVDAVLYATYDAAIAAGKRPCGVCKPLAFPLR